jgi:hypothetical protein
MDVALVGLRKKYFAHFIRPSQLKSLNVFYLLHDRLRFKSGCTHYYQYALKSNFVQEFW